MKYLLAAMLLALSSATYAAIYKWVDQDGNIHFSQTPPPDQTTQQASVIGERSALTHDDIDPAYCSAVQEFATGIANNMRRGVSVRDTHAHLRGVGEEVKQNLGTNEPVVKQIIYAVYGYRPSSLSPSAIGRLLQRNCMNGSFASTNTRRQAAAGKSQGTGWPVTTKVVVTNFHVIKGHSTHSLKLPDGAVLKASVIATDESKDVALLRIADGDHRFQPIPLDTAEQQVGLDVFTVGYPHADVMGDEAKLTNGIINSTTGYRNDPRTFQISVPLQAGNSGGPLMNLRGGAVGIVTSKLSAVRLFEATGDLPQNVNYAVKSRYVKALLDQHNLTDYQDQTARPEAALATVAASVKRQVVMILSE